MRFLKVKLSFRTYHYQKSLNKTIQLFSVFQSFSYLSTMSTYVQTKETYPISSVKRLLHNGQPTRDGVRKMYKGMISTSLFATFGLIASL